MNTVNMYSLNTVESNKKVSLNRISVVFDTAGARTFSSVFADMKKRKEIEVTGRADIQKIKAKKSRNCPIEN
jgi:hypothetical protein